MRQRPSAFLTSIGTKLLIGLTGVGLVLYLVLHIAGNLLVFLGPRTFNGYAERLVSNPLVVPIEIGLLLIFLLHAYKAVTMYLANQRARPVRYVRKERAGPPSRKTFASTTMILSGLWLLLFVIIHVKTFKYGTYYVESGTGVRDLYRLEMENFSSGLTAALYVVSMLVVGSHLWHGASSALQSLGADQPRWTPGVLMAGRALAGLIAGGFIVIVLWAYFTGGRS